MQQGRSGVLREDLKKKIQDNGIIMQEIMHVLLYTLKNSERKISFFCVPDWAPLHCGKAIHAKHSPREEKKG